MVYDLIVYHFYDDLLLSNINSDFKDNVLNNKIKEYLLKEIKDLVYIKTLFLTVRNKGEKPAVEILKNGIRFDNKIFRLKNNDYHALQFQLLDYISDLKNNVNNQ